MKKLAALSLALVSAASVAQAQDAGGFRIGVKVGGTYSNISGDNVSQITGANYSTDLGDYKLGYNAGIGLSIPLSSDGFFSFAPELLYNRKGYEIQSKQTTGLATGVSSVEIEQKRVLHYLDVPLLAKINAGGLFFELGPQVSYLFGSKNKQQTTTKYANGQKDKVDADSGFRDYTGVSRDDAYKSDLAQFDISGVAGVGYMTDGGISLGLRYARGFNSLIDSKDQDNEPKAFNNAFTLQLGYLIPTK
ncbi:opacity protein-like surface antigen [Hymenobacter luteus]|uniref:Opacity protein-like surface antigen n=2 Tax=Hymenobacter TaxID=89966 RepID=A0A7W9WE84_9BACT|nr:MULTISPECIES: porin family protein [Hymenobacter]MBB4602521.1 opacity protein-like surface antigen [Hymenobacter latericoloratus]MBB6060412.1 opacity protein-like surface antigen [Hymenobacter luteus]